jgi:hydroxyacylglutathione hydrolase
MKTISNHYKIKQIYENTYSIADTDINPLAVYMYLLVGEKKALLIDSGYGGLDLHKITSSVTDKEVICACSHGHVDHALGAYQFEAAYLHSNDFDLYQQHGMPEKIRSYGYSGMSAKLPNPKVKDPGYIALVERIASIHRKGLLPLESLEAFDLGGRTVAWYLLPGHTQGSVAFLDEKFHTIFDGDAAPIGVFLFLPESSSVQDYREHLINYKGYLEKNAVTRRFTGHSNTSLGVKPIQNLIDCSKVILKGKRKGLAVHMAFGEAKLMLAKSALMFIK